MKTDADLLLPQISGRVSPHRPRRVNRNGYCSFVFSLSSRRPDLFQLFPGDTEMARRMRAFDWTRTPLGPPDTWPDNLRTSLRIMLTSPHPMSIWWGEQLITLYNDGYAAFLHQKHPSALGQPAADVWREIWDEIGPRAEFARQQEVGSRDEATPLVVLRKGDPEEIYVAFAFSPISIDGSVGGILCLVTDETDRIVGERRLTLLEELAARTADARTPREACALAAAALATNPDDLPFALIYLRNEERRAMTLLGRSGLVRDGPAAPDDIDPQRPGIWPIREALDARRTHLVTDLTAVADFLPLARGAFRVTRAVIVPLAAGEPQWPVGGLLVAGLSPLRQYDAGYERFVALVAGELSAAVASSHAYEAEQRRVEALAALDRAKTEFFGNLSHELRTPLTLMLGPLEEALQAAAKPDQLEFVYRNALRLMKLVNTLLDFSRIEAGRIEPAYAPTDLAALTADLANVFRTAIEKARMRLVVDCPPLPEPVYVDRDMWEQIVLNLMSNAFKFTFTGEIRVALRAEEDRARLTVSDTGGGIPASELRHVFERFHRVPGARSRTHEGTGIGLALVRQLVALHGGDISAQSVVGRGTTFTVLVPFGKAHLHAERIVSDTSSSSGARPRREAFVDEAELWLPDSEPLTATGAARPPNRSSHSKPRSRVLIADDNADLRRYVAGLLGRDHDVLAVNDGEAALAAIETRQPDLVIADVMMPGLDGYQLLRRVRADPEHAHLPIILLSARAGEDARVEGLGHGADDYLIKPFSARELRARVEAHLDLARRRRVAEQALQVSNERLEHMVWQRTAALRQSEARLMFLMRLGDALRPLHDAEAIKATASRMLRTHLNADRVSYSEIATSDEHTVSSPEGGSGGQSIPDGPRVADFSPWISRELRASHPVVIEDTNSLGVDSQDLPAGDITIKVRAFIVCPVVEAGRLVATVDLAQATPRKWTAAEVGLVEETAERTRAAVERARAERAIQEDLADTRQLQQLSAATVRQQNITELYDAMLETAISIMRADSASLERLDVSGDCASLRLLAARTPDERAEQAPQAVPVKSHTTCDIALRTRSRVIVDDADACAFIAGTAEQAQLHETGIRALQTTPLVSRGGRVLGMLSTYWHDVHTPPERNLRRLDVLVRQITDLMERSDAEAALRASEAQLKETDQRQDEFLAVLAHELRNPLAPIRTGLELIRLAEDNPQAVLRIRRMMERQVAHMVRLIDDLLDVSRITSGKIRLQRQLAPLEGLINTVIEANRAALTAANLDFHVSLPEAPVFLDVDPTRFVQVVSNVLQNAIKFTPGGGAISVSAAAERSDATGQETLSLSITDSGAGIPRDMLPHVFDLFTQGAAASSHTGLGIGLALARKLIELHGGSIEAFSDGTGRGSTFTIHIPVAAGKPAAAPARSEDGTGRIAVRAMVIDDNVDAADTLAMLVSNLGGEATVAYTGDTGVTLALESKPDVVFIDIGMPGIDGYETCRRIRQGLGTGVMLVALTGWGQEQDKQHAASAGFNAHLTKPADPVTLERLLADIRPARS